MKKIKSRFIIILFAVFAFTISLTTYSFAFTINGTDMSYDADLASYAEKNSEKFMEIDFKKLLNNTVEPGGGSRHGRGSEINFPTSGCFYHRESNLGGTKNKIVGVIDIDGVNTKVNGKAIEFSSNTQTRVKQEYAISKMAYAVWLAQSSKSTEGNTPQKNAIRYIWFKDDFCWMLKKYSDIPKSFYTNAINGAETNSGSYVETIKEVQKNKYYELQKTDSGKQILKKDSNGNQYLGPFKVKYNGYDNVSNLTLTVDGVKYDISEYYTKSSNTYTKHTGDVVRNKNFYIKLKDNIDTKDGKKHTWSLNLKTGTKKVYQARILLISNPRTTGQNLLIWAAQQDKTKDEVEWKGIINSKTIPQGEDLRIIKIDAEDETPLEGVEFQFKTEITVKRLQYTSIEFDYSHPTLGPLGIIVYPTWQQNHYEDVVETFYLGRNGKWGKTPSTFTTDENGEINVANLTLPVSDVISNEYIGQDEHTVQGEYAIRDGRGKPLVTPIEISNKNYGYEITSPVECKQVAVGTTDDEEVQITNKKAKTKISGFVWIDEHNGKTSVTDGLYKSEQGEQGLDGIDVYLKDIYGNVVDTTKTQSLGIYPIGHGEYQFDDIDINMLKNRQYVVDFEYCGVTYEAVPYNIQSDNGSKANEVPGERDLLNQMFSEVKANPNGSQTLNQQGLEIRYNPTVDHKSTIAGCTHNADLCEITATTDEVPGYNVFDNYDANTGEVRFINLGLVKKEQTDYALTKDLDNVRVEVNNGPNNKKQRSHIYKYGTKRYTNDIPKTDAFDDMTIKFQTDNDTYTRDIYESDARDGVTDESTRIGIYVTYKIALRNEGAYNGKINSIVDYCDSRLDLIRVGTSIENEMSSNDIGINGITVNQSDANIQYIINVNQELDSHVTKFIYLQFRVSQTGIYQLIRSKAVDMYNTAEIYSYTTFKEGTKEPLAVVDNDSIPGNAVLGTISTYEDDTDTARTFRLQIGIPRSIKGTVFVDSTSNERQTAKRREGDGKYTDDENTVKGVEVELFDNETGETAKIYDEITKQFKEAKYTTGTDGNFEFEGYLPGNYVIKYTWGDKTYTVQYYKGTIYNKDRYDKIITLKNERWYLGGNDDISNDRLTDALDDKNTRSAIDEEMTKVKENIIENEIKKAYNGGSNIIKNTKMTSTTPNMEMGVECIIGVTTDRNFEGKFEINNVDFGIVKRAIQELDLKKRVIGYKIVLANGQVLVNAELDVDGNIKGTYPYTIPQKPQIINGVMDRGLIKTEIDNELIEGATLEIKYQIDVTNVGELDYTTWDYYFFGTIPSDEYLVKVSVDELIDYVDGKLSVIDNENNWILKDKDYLEETNASKKDNANILKTYMTEQLKGGMTPKDPNNKKSVTLQTSKLLTNTDDNEYNNTAEIVRVSRPPNTPSNPNQPGDPSGVPVKTWPTPTTFRFNREESQTVSILPSTGANRNYAMPIIVSVIVITVFGVGIVLIKKFVVDK